MLFTDKPLVLDLKNPAEREEFLELVKKARVVAESFRPGVMERLGLGYETRVSKSRRCSAKARIAPCNIPISNSFQKSTVEDQ